jgi:hypothetical protein
VFFAKLSRASGRYSAPKENPFVAIATANPRTEPTLPILCYRAKTRQHNIDEIYKAH